MRLLTILSPADQVAGHLRSEIRGGVWQEEIPGAPLLARELGVDAKTVLAALTQLESEGLLVGRGVGRRRLINREASVGNEHARPLRVGILLNETTDRRREYIGEVQHRLIAAGHQIRFGSKTMMALGSDVSRLSRLLETEKADAWVVVGGTREVLTWLSGQSFPAFALFGRIGGLPIAAVLPEKIPAYEAAVDRLAELGHRRIVMLARKSRRIPEPGRTERAFLMRLQSHGIPTGAYNLPDWEDDKKGFLALLDRLFGTTPPTALVIQEAFLFSAAHQYLTRRGIRVPEDVSMVCSDDDISFDWWEPAVSHIHWDILPVAHRVVHWVSNVSRGKVDMHQTLTKAVLVEGGTISGIRHRA